MAIGLKFFLLGLLLSISSVSAAGKCKVCDSTSEKCATAPQDIESKDCDAECFTLVDNDGKIKRGCVSDDNKCDGENCVKCTAAADACNIKTPFTCKTCDSSKDVNCSKNPNTFLNKICDDGITKCLVRIKDDKHTERRCVTKNDEACEPGKKCNICDTTGCNKDIFPADRRRCYQCDASAKCSNPWQNPAEVLSLPCTLYDEAEKCYVYGTTAEDMARGCASDTSNFAKCTDAKEKCQQCDTNSCNSAAFKVSQTLKCIQCKEQDDECPWGYSETAAKECVNQIEFWQSEGCYTKKIGDDKAERGCIHDAVQGFECTAANNCATCSTGSACNKADVMEFSCYKCRSTENSQCSKELANDIYKSEKCRNPVTLADKGCYTERWKDIVIRSCLVDADYETKKNCLDPNYSLCKTCLTKDCNTFGFSNSAQSVALASSLLGLTLLVFRFL